MVEYHEDATCTVEWRAPMLLETTADGTFVRAEPPADSRIAYHEVRQKAPKFLIDFFCRKVNFQ